MNYTFDCAWEESVVLAIDYKAGWPKTYLNALQKFSIHWILIERKTAPDLKSLIVSHYVAFDDPKQALEFSLKWSL